MSSSRPASGKPSLARVRPSGATRISTIGKSDASIGTFRPFTEPKARSTDTRMVATPSSSTATTCQETISVRSSDIGVWGRSSPASTEPSVLTWIR